MRSKTLPLLTAGLLIATGSCGGDDPVEPDAPVTEVASLELVGSYASKSPVGDSIPVTVRALDTSGSPVVGADVNWRVETGGGSFLSSATRTDASGIAASVWVLGEAPADQSARAVAEEVSAFLSIATEAGPPHEIRATPDSIQFSEVGDSTTLSASAFDSFGNRTALAETLSWWSTDTMVVVVADTQAVGVGNGQATVIASHGDLADTIEVVVDQVAAALDITPDSMAVGIDSSRTISAVVRDAGGSPVEDASISWTSRSDAIATVSSSGLATGVSSGSTWVLASHGDLVDSARVAVLQLPVELHLVPDSTVIGVDSSATINAVVTDANGASIDSAEVSWVSGDGTIATVSSRGEISGAAPGTTYIAASVANLADSTRVEVKDYGPWVSLSAYANHTCGITVSGDAYCWGLDGYGQLAGGSGGVSTTPVLVEGSHTWQSITTGRSHTCAITTSGDAYCWGRNSSGQLGDGTTTDRSVPVAVVGAYSWAELSAGNSHTCGVTVDGEGFCWGYNGHGSLGDGSTNSSSAPRPVAASVEWQVMDAGEIHTCGVASSGTVYCWGDNQFGQLGDESTSDSNSPQAITGSLTFTDVEAGEGHTCGLTPGGEVYCWGQNYYGQLGDTTATESVGSPVLVSGPQTWASMSAGGWHACSLTDDSLAYCWGRNDDAGLGDGTTVDSSVPVAVLGSHNWRNLTAGLLYTCGVTVDGNAYCWGNNNYGELGYGGSGGSSWKLQQVADPPQ